MFLTILSLIHDQQIIFDLVSHHAYGSLSLLLSPRGKENMVIWPLEMTHKCSFADGNPLSFWIFHFEETLRKHPNCKSRGTVVAEVYVLNSEYIYQKPQGLCTCSTR